jgi:formamidopyrimidine-DNA glycosylase
MPELPEVETIVRDLRPHLEGRVVADVQVSWPRTIAEPPEDVERFRAGVVGRRIASVRRRGKLIWLCLDDGQSLLIHLRMSGRLVLQPAESDRHLRVTISLAHAGASTDGGGKPERSHLYFYDQRKFGRIWLTGDAVRMVALLGPEPLASDFSPEELAMRLAKRRGALKPLLLNQRVIAGLGNIYADEALFCAGLHPRRAANTLNMEEIIRLHAAIQMVLQQAVGLHGTTFDGLFVRPDGEEGRHQEGLRVYGQAGLPCLRCGTLIERIVVGGRGTHICPRCQPLTREGAGKRGACH